MVHACNVPATGVMAAFTGGIGGEMRRMFARGGTAVMATDTAAADIRMIHSCALPEPGRVAAFTGVTGLEMRGGHTGGEYAVMTVVAASLYFVMVNPVDQGPVKRQVAAITVIRAGNMITGFG